VHCVENVACQAIFSTQFTHLATRLSRITTATTGQTTIGSGTQSDLLMMGIKIAGRLGGKMCALCGECCLSGNILHTVQKSCHPTLQHHNSYNRTDNHRQWNAVGSPDDGHKDVRNMLRYY